VRERGAGSWVLDEIEAAISGKRFSVGTITRAGDFMRRQGMLDAATKCAKYAVENGRGLLPAYVLGLRCGLASGDKKWTRICARQAMNSALQPMPFYRLLAEIDNDMMSTEAGTVELLEKLKAACPDEPKWATRLGDVYLRRGEGQNALRVLEAVMASRPENADLYTMLLAAEAARLSGKIERSVQILERAYAVYPGNRVVLNNLVYSLAFNKKTIPRARELVPKLLDAWGESFVAFDTAAVVYLNAGETDMAKEFLVKARNSVRDIDPIWMERNRSAVDIDAYLGKYEFNLSTSLSELIPKGRRTAYDAVAPLAHDLQKTMKDKTEKR